MLCGGRLWKAKVVLLVLLISMLLVWCRSIGLGVGLSVVGVSSGHWRWGASLAQGFVDVCCPPCGISLLLCNVGSEIAELRKDLLLMFCMRSKCMSMVDPPQKSKTRQGR